ncbi:MAG: hypothetical protein AAGG81_05690, partial [Chlamydiota bacterium]
IIYKIDKYRKYLPTALNDFDIDACPPPKDWGVYYKIKISQPTFENVLESWKKIHKNEFEKYCLTQATLSHKDHLSIKFPTPRLHECNEESNNKYKISFSKSNLENSNILGLLFHKEEIDFESIKKVEVNQKNEPVAALLNVWAEKILQIKMEWLTHTTCSLHPLLLHELGITTFELNPTFVGFKVAYEYILLGTLRVSVDVTCSSGQWLHEIPQIIKAKYIERLLKIARERSHGSEIENINNWMLGEVPKTYSKKVMKRFIEFYDEQKVTPNPEWLFTHHPHYDPSINYNYDQENLFALPEWLWKKRRNEYFNKLKYKSETGSV